MKTCTNASCARYVLRERRWGYLFVAAPFVQFLIFSIIPVAFSIYASFTNWNVFSDIKMVGLRNYTQLFTDERFWRALTNTLVYYIGIPVGMLLALLLAIMMQKDVLSNKVFRVVFYLPAVSSVVAISILWSWIYNADYGILNLALRFFGIQGPNWLSDPRFIKPAMIIMGVWSGLGPTILLLLAALKNVPVSLYEAAAIDGAGGIRRFFHITLPMIKPVLFYFLVLGFINNMQTFGSIYVMIPGGGAEYSGASIVFYLWQKGFTNYQLGYACAVAWVLAIITFGATWLQFRLRGKEDG